MSPYGDAECLQLSDIVVNMTLGEHALKAHWSDFYDILNRKHYDRIAQTRFGSTQKLAVLAGEAEIWWLH